jgi:lysozyme family protein
MRVLCIGGVANGEYRNFVYDPKHGMTFQVAEKMTLADAPIPVGRMSKEMAADISIRSEVYRLHQFNLGSSIVHWLAAPHAWTTSQLFDRLVKGYQGASL